MQPWGIKVTFFDINVKNLQHLIPWYVQDYNIQRS